ncbi:transcriptional regulator, PbsX family [Burkholderia multivorans CF2]|nr:transcriptional regulator, PbsX family [Burkholderia multivorans CF2]
MGAMGCHLGFYGETKLVTAKHSLATAIRTVRKARGLSQEAFSDVSSRTYMSSLERDLKSPTMHKLTELCEVMDVHPLTLLTLAYAGDSTRKADQLLAQVRQELEAVLKERDTP